MSNVNLAIGGRTYTVACAAGEEEHVLGLGRMIADKLQAMGNAAGQTETRQLLFAALLLADEVHEARHRGGSPSAVPASGEGLVDPGRLEAIADALEKCAAALEG